MAGETDWRGVFPATATPFTKDGEIDERAFRSVIDQQLEEGAHGIIVAGSTGEWFSLTDRERIRMFEIGRDQSGRQASSGRHVRHWNRPGSGAHPGGKKNRL